jgi:hypothetical protein
MEIVPRTSSRRWSPTRSTTCPTSSLHVLDNVVVQVVDRHPTSPTCSGCTRAFRTPSAPARKAPTSCRSTGSRCARCADDLDELADEVYVTVIHEIAHAAGIDDDRLHELGWA